MCLHSVPRLRSEQPIHKSCGGRRRQISSPEALLVPENVTFLHNETNETKSNKSHLSGIDRLLCLYLWAVKHTEDEYRTVKELLADPDNFVFRIQMLLLCVARFGDLPNEAVVQASFRRLVVITKHL